MSLTKILLKEFQSKNYLYHFTSISDASKIIDDNVLKGSSSLSATELTKSKVGNWDEFSRKLKSGNTIEGVSLTRNRRLLATNKNLIGGAFGSINLIAFTFDRNKLNSRYKLIPFDAHHDIGGSKQRVLDEEIVIGNIDNVRSLIEFIYIDKEFIDKEIQDIEYFISRLMEFYKTYKKYFPFKVFEKGNFKDIDVEVSSWSGNTDFDRGSPELEMYKQIFK